MAKTYFDRKKLNTTALSLLFLATFSQSAFGMREEDTFNNQRIQKKEDIQKKEELKEARKNLIQTEEEQNEKLLKNFYESALNAEERGESEKARKFLKKHVSLSKTLNKDSDVQVLIKLGELYSEIGKTRKALKLIKEAADTENLDAMYSYARILGDGYQSERAIKLFEKLIEKGDLRGARDLIEIYSKGQHFYNKDRDLEKNKIIKLTKRIEQEGDRDLLLWLLNTYECKDFEGQDLNKVVELYEKVGGEEGNEGFIKIAKKYSQDRYIVEDKAVELYEKAKKRGSFEAARILLEIYTNENMNSDKIKECLLIGEQNGSIEDLFHLVENYYCDDNYAFQDKNKGMEIYQRIEKEGSIGDLFQLANRYGRGEYVDKNKNKVMEIYQRIEKEGSIDDLFELAKRYGRGEYVDKNKNKVMEIYQRIEKEGSIDNLFKLAKRYGRGEYVDKNKGMEIYQRIEKEGSIDDLFELAKRYSRGEYVDKNKNKVMEIYQRIEKEGSIDDLFQLAEKYYYREDGDKNKAVELYEKVGDHQALVQLINIYENTKSIKKIVTCIEKLVRVHGDNYLLRNLRELYVKGEESVVKNPSVLFLLSERKGFWETCKTNENQTWKEQQFTLRKQAADLGHPEATYWVGYTYLRVEKNAEKAREYFEKAAELGNDDAKVALAGIYLEEEQQELDKICTMLLNIDVKKRDDLKNDVANHLSGIIKKLEKNNETIEQMEYIYFYLACLKSDIRDNEEEIEFLLDDAVEIAEKNGNAALLNKISGMYYVGEKNIKKNHRKAKILSEKAKKAMIQWNRSETRAIPAQCGFKEEKGIITLKTDVLLGESYLLESLPLKNFQKKNKVKISFRPQGTLEGISFAIRDIKNRRLFPEKGLSLKSNVPIDFETVIPEAAGDEISVVFFNWGPTKAIDFTVQNFNLQKEEIVKPGSLFYGWNRSETRAIPARCDFKEEKGIIRLETNALPGESYLLESLPLKNLQKKDKLKVSFRPKGTLEGISFAIRDIKNRRLFPKKGLSLKSNELIDFETEIPEDAGDEISVVFFNWGRSNATNFTIRNLEIEKEEAYK